MADDQVVAAIRMQKLRAWRKDLEEQQKLQSDPLYAFDKALETLADEKAKEKHPLALATTLAVNPRTIYRQRASFRKTFIQQTMENSPYTFHPETGKALTACGFLYEYFMAMSLEDRTQAVKIIHEYQAAGV